MMRLLLAVIVTGLWVGCSNEPQNKAAPQQQPLVIDVRSQEEWDAGHLEIAVLIPHTEIGQGIARVAPDKSQPIFLHCRSGVRAGKAEAVLREMGYTNVENVGGIEDARARFESE